MPKPTQVTRRVILCGMVGVLNLGRVEASENIPRYPWEWKQRLSTFEYRVMREGYNELAGTSPLSRETRPGLYRCKGCGLDVFSSTQKINGGTGWPSFSQPISGRVITRRNGRFFGIGTNIGCTRCGSHLGILQNRTYRMNGLALRFSPAENG